MTLSIGSAFETNWLCANASRDKSDSMSPKMRCYPVYKDMMPIGKVAEIDRKYRNNSGHYTDNITKVGMVNTEKALWKT